MDEIKICKEHPPIRNFVLRQKQKNMRTRFFIYLMAGATIFCACDKQLGKDEIDTGYEEPDNPDDGGEEKPSPVLTLESGMLEVPVYGGTYELTYEIENAYDSLELKVVGEDDWVNQVDKSINGKITFNVDNAVGERTRSTEIQFIYGDAEEVLTVTQYASVNEISLSVTDVADTAKYSISVTDDDGYLLCLRKADDYRIYDDRQLLIKLLGEDGVTDGVLNGTQSGVLRDLEPKTDYMLVAFGYENGFATTMPFKAEFTTPRVLDCNVEYKYFDGSALYESNPVTEYEQYWGKVVLVMTAEPLGDCTEYYYNLLTPYMASMDDNTIIGNLKTNGYSEPVTVSVLPNVYYGTTQTLASISFDADGNSGVLHKSDIAFSKDGVSPVEEFEF